MAGWILGGVRRMTAPRHARLVGLAAACAFSLANSAAVIAGELVQNGSFETGSFGPYWVHGAYRGNQSNPDLADHVVVPDLPYTGSYSARLGFKFSKERKSAVGFMYQDVAIPANISSAWLYFKARQQGYDTNPYDPFAAQIRNTSNAVLRTLLSMTFSDPSYTFKDSGWVSDDNVSPVGVDMLGFAGQTVRIYFEQANTNDNLWETWAYVDDVSLVCKRFVDLALNGNGNDIFGAVGSGAGGAADASTFPADTAVFYLDVENEGRDVDTYRLTINAPSGWATRVDAGSGPVPLPYTTRAMSPGEIAQYRVLVVPPAGTSAGGYNAVLDAVSTTGPTRFDSVRMGVNVLQAAYGTDLVVEGNGYGVTGDGGSGGYALKTGAWNTPVSYALELRNTGDVPTAFRVSATTSAGATWRILYLGSPHASAFNTDPVAPGAVATMTLEATVPPPNPGGDYQTIVYSRAIPDTLERDSIRAVLRLLAPRVDLVIGGNGDGIYDRTGSGLGGSSTSVSELGYEIVFPVSIQNESGISDSYDLSWVPPKANWTAVVAIDGVEYGLPRRTPVIPAHSTVDIELRITMPGNTKLGTYSSIFNAVSVANNAISESVTAAMTITPAGQIDLVIDGNGAGVYGGLGSGLGGSSERTISPGDSATFAVGLQNLSGANAIDVSWSTPPGWRITFDGRTSPATRYPAGTYPLKVVVPATSPGGSFDIIIDGQKTERRFYVDSIRGRVYVTPRRVVDAVIDGNGDGLYGLSGTGLGGSSSQLRSAPALLRFTIELQNEGGGADVYTVAWNTIPAWQATINGNASPYTTGTIAAGDFSLLTFEVSVPLNAFAGVYRYVIDVASSSDPSVVESIEARVTIVGPPRADLAIDGNGAGVFGLAGTGDGGYSLRAANPGASFAAALELRNAGSYADSFLVFWQTPAGWPASSVVVNDGPFDHTGPFWTPIIGANASLFYTVRVEVPAGAGVGSFSAIIDSHSSLAPQFPESVELAAQTASVVRGVVFDDRDHDGSFGPGDAGLGGVRVTETGSGLALTTGGDGRFTILVTGGSMVTVVEQNLSGYVSLSPDTVGPAALSAGDTLTADFADVPGIRISSGMVLNAPAGAYADFPHRLDAGTRGAITMTAAADTGVVTMFLLDENEDGLFNGSDRVLDPSDLDMDPAAGHDHVCVMLRVFVPMSSPPGTTHLVRIDAVQTIAGTSLASRAQASDAVVVIDGTAGMMVLHKSVDSGVSSPGGVLTYTIVYTNTGVDSVQNILILDPVSVYVDVLPGTFGPGMDVEWRKDGSTIVYLTLAPGDGDECDYSQVEHLLRLSLSKNTPYLLEPGESGELTYRVIVK